MINSTTSIQKNNYYSFYQPLIFLSGLIGTTICMNKCIRKDPKQQESDYLISKKQYQLKNTDELLMLFNQYINTADEQRTICNLDLVISE